MPLRPTPYAQLKHVARYVRQFRRRVFVVKLGGELLESASLRRAVAEQLALLESFSIRLVLVHGGGSGLDAACAAQGLPVEKVAGRRITSPAVLDVAKGVFAGRVHTDLLAELQAAGLSAVGLSGMDAGLVTAAKRPPVAVDGATVDFGLVGDVQAVDPAVLLHLLEGGYTPVVAPLTGDGQGGVYNTNADTLAAALAAALGAEKLVFLLTVPGLLADPADPSTLVPCASLGDLDALEARGAVKAGMRPKLAAARAALAQGVRSVHLVSGVAPEALLGEVFTNEGTGTMIQAEAAAVAV